MSADVDAQEVRGCCRQQTDGYSSDAGNAPFPRAAAPVQRIERIGSDAFRLLNAVRHSFHFVGN